MKRQAYRRKRSIGQSDNNSLATLLGKGTHARLCEVVNQGCQTYGPRAKTGPLRGWIRPAGWFCNVKTSLFAWEVYAVILQQLVTRFQLLETLPQLLIFYCFSHVKMSVVVFKVWVVSFISFTAALLLRAGLCAITLLPSLWLPDVLVRQELSLNLVSKLVVSLILEKHLFLLECLPTSLKIFNSF